MAESIMLLLNKKTMNLTKINFSLDFSNYLETF